MFTRLSALAPTGNAEVQYNLGMFLNNGIGTPTDNQAAFKSFTAAAEAGHELAAFKVGCYLAGQFPGTVTVDEAEALRFKLRAAEAGYDLAQFDVGMHFSKRRDLANAMLWWERASHQGNKEATAYLAHHLSGDASPDKARGYAIALLLKDMMPTATTELTARINALEAQLSAGERADAAALRATWITGPTPLTIKAQAGMKAVPELIASLERR